MAPVRSGLVAVFALALAATVFPGCGRKASAPPGAGESESGPGGGVPGEAEGSPPSPTSPPSAPPGTPESSPLAEEMVPEGPFRLGDLAPPPRWERLHRFQRSLTRDEFVGLLEGVYGEAEGRSWETTIKVFDTHAEIVRSTHEANEAPPFHLHFAREPQATAPPRFWREPGELPPVADLELRPMEGVRVAIDPGHIGGAWARSEERWFQIGNSRPVMEGTMTLATAKHLRGRLEELGAEVILVREKTEPVTSKRPSDFREEARAILRAQGIDPDDPPASAPAPLTTEWQAEKLFYRTSEIRARADRVNEQIRPDLVVCLHFNAEAWGNPARPSFVDGNHFHVLVNGCYSAGEIALDDQRFDLLDRLLQRIHRTEQSVAEVVSTVFAARTGLPPYVYVSRSARHVGDNPHVYARNLLANRVYKCPVLFLEPWVMNHAEVHARVQAGDYEGSRIVAGRERPSLYREYADAVAAGLAEFYRRTRLPGGPADDEGGTAGAEPAAEGGRGPGTNRGAAP